MKKIFFIVIIPGAVRVANAQTTSGQGAARTNQSSLRVKRKQLARNTATLLQSIRSTIGKITNRNAPGRQLHQQDSKPLVQTVGIQTCLKMQVRVRMIN